MRNSRCAPTRAEGNCSTGGRSLQSQTCQSKQNKTRQIERREGQSTVGNGQKSGWGRAGQEGREARGDAGIRRRNKPATKNVAGAVLKRGKALARPRAFRKSAHPGGGRNPGHYEGGVPVARSPRGGASETLAPAVARMCSPKRKKKKMVGRAWCCQGMFGADRKGVALGKGVGRQEGIGT